MARIHHLIGRNRFLDGRKEETDAIVIPIVKRPKPIVVIPAEEAERIGVHPLMTRFHPPKAETGGRPEKSPPPS